MDKKHKSAKYSLKKPSACLHEKGTKVRTMTGNTRKSTVFPAEQKSSQGVKEKRLPIMSQKDVQRSLLPFYSPTLSRAT